MRPLLANSAIKPAPADIQWTRDAFLDLLRIRASSRLFRLTSAEQVQQRLRFLNTGPDQLATVVVGHLDGAGLAGANFSQLLYLINVSPQPQSLNLPSEANKGYRLHPVHLAPGAADQRIAAQARYHADGRIELPARSAVVLVVE